MSHDEKINVNNLNKIMKKKLSMIALMINDDEMIGLLFGIKV